VGLPVPDYTTLCRRAGTLPVQLPKRASGGLHLVMDSSGLKVYGEGEWKVRQHGYRQRRTWRKFHLSVEERPLEIQEVTVTEAATDDASQVGGLREASDEVDQVSAEGSYDKRQVYTVCQQRGVKRIAIPPRPTPPSGRLATARRRPIRAMAIYGVFGRSDASGGNGK